MDNFGAEVCTECGEPKHAEGPCVNCIADKFVDSDAALVCPKCKHSGYKRGSCANCLADEFIHKDTTFKKHRKNLNCYPLGGYGSKGTNGGWIEKDTAKERHQTAKEMGMCTSNRRLYKKRAREHANLERDEMKKKAKPGRDGMLQRTLSESLPCANADHLKHAPDAVDCSS